MENTISVILPIKSSLTRDFNEYYGSDISENDIMLGVVGLEV
jgi:hypothetical protein